MPRLSTFVVMVICALAVTASLPPSVDMSPPPDSYDDYLQLMGQAANEYRVSLGGPAFDRFLALLPKDDDRDLYYMEGDYVLRRHEVGEYLKWLTSSENAAPPNNGELILGKLPDGSLDRFGPSERTITMWVNRESFPPSLVAQLDNLRHWLSKAARNWNDICGAPCQLDIRIDDCDTPKCATNKNLDIEVSYSFTSGAIAEAPFPSRIIQYRTAKSPFPPKLLVSNRLFDASAATEPLHIMRHELGHVLGYRHENVHTKTTPGACVKYESGQILALGQFDPLSVMYVQCDNLAPAKPLPGAIDGFSSTDRKLHKSKEYYGL